MKPREETNTPRTDHVMQHGLQMTDKREILWLCKELETELAAAQQKLEQAKAERDELKKRVDDFDRLPELEWCKASADTVVAIRNLDAKGALKAFDAGKVYVERLKQRAEQVERRKPLRIRPRDSGSDAEADNHRAWIGARPGAGAEGDRGMKFTDELERLLNGATPGPWSQGMRNGHNAANIYSHSGDTEHDDPAVCSVYGIPLHTSIDEKLPERYLQGLATGKLIVHLANAAPALLELVRAADRLNELKKIKEEIEADSSDTTKTLSLKLYYERNKEEAWQELRAALARLEPK